MINVGYSVILYVFLRISSHLFLIFSLFFRSAKDFSEKVLVEIALSQRGNDLGLQAVNLLKRIEAKTGIKIEGIDLEWTQDTPINQIMRAEKDGPYAFLNETNNIKSYFPESSEDFVRLVIVRGVLNESKKKGK